MYIFSRTRRARTGRIFDALPAAAEIAQKASSVSGLDVTTWMVRFGEPAGTFIWSVRADSQADLAASMGKLAADGGYVDAVRAIDELFEGETTDRLVQVLSGTPSDEPSPYVMITEASMAGGTYAEAVAFGIEMQQYVGAERGQPTAFGKATYGGFGDVVWFVGADSMEQVDDGAAWLISDAGYLDRVAKASGLFIDGSGHNRLLERIG